MKTSSKFEVNLTKKDRAYLQKLLDDPKHKNNSNIHKRIKILLNSDSGKLGPNWTYKQIENELEVSDFTIWNTKKKYSEGGIDHAVLRKRSKERQNSLEVNLTKNEREFLESFLQNPEQKYSTNLINRVKILLYTDDGKFGPNLKYQEIADKVGVSTFTIWNIRKKYSEKGINFAIFGKNSEKEWNSQDVSLDKKEREYLESILKNPPENSSTNWVNRVRILLNSDNGEFGPDYSYEQMEKEIGVSNVTIWKIRKLYNEEGIEGVLGEF